MNTYQVPDFHRLTPSSEIKRRLAGLQAALLESGLDAALLVYPVDLFYFTGTLQAGHLLVPSHGPAVLLIRRDLDRARAESPLDGILELTSFNELPGRLRESLGPDPATLGMELDILPVNLFQRYQALWPRTRFVDVSPLVMELRAVKSEYEIQCMRRAGELADRVYGRIPEMMKPGQTEMELAGLITSEAYAGGHQNQLRMRAFDLDMYTWHVISGESGGIRSVIDAAFAGYGVSPAFPMGASQKIMRRGESILIDFGICLDGYQVDLTRMFSLGPPPNIITEACQALAEIESVLMQNLYPGQPAGPLFDLAVDRAEKLGFGEAFLGTPGRKVRFVAHGLGLEINEPPIVAPGRTQVLCEGMTVALELKMVFPGVGAAGLENTVAILADGPKKLTLAREDLVMV
jgi:Xaa-Pro aminopeptidase